jgi:hypothetical protein
MIHLTDDDVACLEIDNTRRNTVSGWLWLAGRADPVSLWLTGNGEPVLAGRRLRWEARATVAGARSGRSARRRSAAACWSGEQVGPTGWMGIAIGPGGALGHDDARGGPRLVIEWFGQDGPVVLELPAVDVEILEGPPLVLGEGTAYPDGVERPWSWTELAASTAEAPRRRKTPPRTCALPPARGAASLFDDVPLKALFDPPLCLVSAERLDDREVEVALKRLLARLALEEVALDMCEHVSPRDAYRLLVRLVTNGTASVPRSRPAGAIERFLTHESCAACLEEIDRFLADDAEPF